MKRKISDKELEIILEATAQQNSGKHGSAEQMFEDVKIGLAEEAAAKGSFWQRAKSPKAVPIWITSFALIVVISILTPILVNYFKPHQSFNLEDLRYEVLSYENLEEKLGDRFIPLTIDDYSVSNVRLYYKPNNEYAGYKIEFINSHNDVSVILTAIFNQAFVTDYDYIFNDISPVDYLGVPIIEVKGGSNNSSQTKLIYRNNLYYIQIIPDTPTVLNTILDEIIS